ncbi:hypothetical protein V8G54_024191, partial [Vigna mungo]
GLDPDCLLSFGLVPHFISSLSSNCSVSTCLLPLCSILVIFPTLNIFFCSVSWTQYRLVCVVTSFGLPMLCIIQPFSSVQPSTVFNIVWSSTCARPVIAIWCSAFTVTDRSIFN